MNEQMSEVGNKKSEMEPVVSSWTRRVSLHGTVTFNDTIYRVPDELATELAGKQIYVFKSPEDGKVRAERVNYDVVPIKDAVFELREMAGVMANGTAEEDDSSDSADTSPDANAAPSSKRDSFLDDLGSDDLRLIAAYEMYADLEMHHRKPFTERFQEMLNERQSELIHRYLSAKIAVLGGNTTLGIINNKKTDAQA